jgi:hypothetical protein
MITRDNRTAELCPSTPLMKEDFVSVQTMTGQKQPNLVGLSWKTANFIARLMPKSLHVVYMGRHEDDRSHLWRS